MRGRLRVAYIHYQQVTPPERLPDGEAGVAPTGQILRRGRHDLLDLALAHAMSLDMRIARLEVRVEA